MEEKGSRYAALAILLAVAALAGCGSGGDASVGFDQVAKASQATTQLKGADIAMTVTMDMDALPHPVTMSGSGFENLRSRTGRFKMDMSALSDLSGNIPSNAYMDEIVVYPRVYMRSPIFAGKVPPGKWLRWDLRATGKQMGFNFDVFTQNDPTQPLRYLSAAGQDLKRLGTEKVRGVPTTHYSGTMDMRKVPEIFPPGPKRDAAKSSVDHLIAAGAPSTYPIAIWIDGRNLVRRMSFTMDMKPQGQHMKMGMTMELFHFGAKPKVKAPPPGKVVDLPSLSGAQPAP